MSETAEYDWIKQGAKLWFNYPDTPDPDEPDYEVVGFVTDVDAVRKGQPILRELKERRGFLGKPAGGLVVTAPRFLLPMPFDVAHDSSPENREWWWRTQAPKYQGPEPLVWEGDYA